MNVAMNDIPLEVERVPSLRCKLNNSPDQLEFTTEDFQLKNMVRFMNKILLGSEASLDETAERDGLQQEEIAGIDL